MYPSLNPTGEILIEQAIDEFDDSTSYIALIDGVEVGLANIGIDEEDEQTIILNSLSFSETHRKNGLGRLLLDHVIDTARETGHKTLEAEINNERLAYLIEDSFLPTKITTYDFDGSHPRPVGDQIDTFAARSILAQARSAQPTGKRDDTMLGTSVYYKVDLT